MDFRDTQGEAMTDTIDATVAAEAPAAEANGGSKAIHARPYPVEVDHSRDARSGGLTVNPRRKPMSNWNASPSM